MSREIKFRVWTGIKMEHQVVVGQLGAFYEGGISPTDSACIGTTTIYPEGTPVMQFTGLLDKNGKEIYEGDIVRFQGQSNRGNWQDFEHKCKIEWHKEWASFMAITLDESEAFNLYSCDYFSLDEIEIIGNIYYNSELLKENTG